MMKAIRHQQQLYESPCVVWKHTSSTAVEAFEVATDWLVLVLCKEALFLLSLLFLRTTRKKRPNSDHWCLDQSKFYMPSRAVCSLWWKASEKSRPGKSRSGFEFHARATPASNCGDPCVYLSNTEGTCNAPVLQKSRVLKRCRQGRSESRTTENVLCYESSRV